MSRSVTNNYDKLRVGGRGFGKTAQAKQTVGQFARDEIADGVDPLTSVTVTGVGGVVYNLTYEEAAEWAFVGDIIDREMKSILEKETP